MKILIATSAWPKSRESFDEICKTFRIEAFEEGVNLVGGILWTRGPACSNLAFELQGDEEIIKKLANKITMALMPSRWTTTKDEIPEVDTWNNI